MSGHAGFSPIGNNIPRPIVNNVPAVDVNANAGNRVNNVPGGGEPQPLDEAPIRAADVAGQLDILLLKAVKNVAAGTDAKDVETQNGTTVFRRLPLWDSPVLLAERDQVELKR